MPEQVPPVERPPRRFPEISTSTAKSIAIIIGAAGAVAVVGYVAYSIANPGAKGGSCATQGTPCNTAISPYQQEFQDCLNQYTQLMTLIVNSGQAPTAAQTAQLAQLSSCMNTAAGNIAATAAQYTPTSMNDLLTEIIEGGAIIAFAVYGLPGIAKFINQLRAQGKITTQQGNGAGIAAVVFNASIQYAIANSMLSVDQIATWESTVNSFTSGEISAVVSFYGQLAAEAVLSEAEAATLQVEYETSLAFDAATTLAALTPLLGYSPMAASPVSGCGTCY